MELIQRACYASREDVKSALDLFEVIRSNAQIDRAIQDASENIDGAMHRRFYPEDTTKFFDWPNFQWAYPWRIWFDQYDLVVATTVTSGGNSIPLGSLFFEPANKGPNAPFTYVEINRSTNAAFGQGTTPQHDVAITGTWGYTAQKAPAGTLAAAVSSASATKITISDGTQLGAGDIAILGTERLLVQDKQATDTTIAFTGLTTASMADNVLVVADGTQFSVGETLQFDTERCLVTNINGNDLVLKRAWDGSILAAHTSGTIYADRLLTVARGQLGTTATTYSNGASISRHVPPGMIRNLAVAEALNSILGETSGYARTVGEDANARPAGGAGLSGKWAQAIRHYGRKARTAAILWQVRTSLSAWIHPVPCSTGRLSRRSTTGWTQ